jgi:hypothetical protein
MKLPCDLREPLRGGTFVKLTRDMPQLAGRSRNIPKGAICEVLRVERVQDGCTMYRAFHKATQEIVYFPDNACEPATN